MSANENLNLLRERIGSNVPDDMLRLSITHRSYAYENGNIPTNERLEFLGDSVLGLVVTDALYLKHPDLPESELAKLRAGVVNSRALADTARKLGLGEFLLLGRGEETSGGREKLSILADAMEAVIGAVYLSCGIEESNAFVHRMLDPVIEEAAEIGAGLDWKTSLQELVSAKGLGSPEYVIEDSGPDHDKHFTARVRIVDRLLGFGEGRSKKEAEQQAAAGAFAELKAE